VAADALCGAIGEIAQLVVTYPIDTVKVLCQAQGTGVGSVVSCLRAQNLGPGRLLGTMYAGCGAAAACSVLIGAAYLVSFYHLQRVLTRCAAGISLHMHLMEEAAMVQGCMHLAAGADFPCPQLWLHNMQGCGRKAAGQASGAGGRRSRGSAAAGGHQWRELSAH
jgi:hypothetical protein